MEELTVTDVQPRANHVSGIPRQSAAVKYDF